MFQVCPQRIEEVGIPTLHPVTPHGYDGNNRGRFGFDGFEAGPWKQAVRSAGTLSQVEKTQLPITTWHWPPNYR